MNNKKMPEVEAARQAEVSVPVYPGDDLSNAAPPVVEQAWQDCDENSSNCRLEQLRSNLLWTLSDKPILVPNTSNAAAFMRWHPSWHDVLTYDAFRQVGLLKKSIPGSTMVEDRFKKRALRDTDYAAAQEWFQKNGMPRLSKQCVVDAMELVCQENRSDRLKQYIDDCQANWDGVPRINDFFTNYFVAADRNAYTLELASKSLMTLVLRAHEPGAFQKMVPILEGPQDIGKSTGLAALCPDPEWFGDSLPPIHNKDASSYLRGMFIIEIAELSATKRADIDDLKSFITRSVEKYRPPYGRQEVEEPRRCMFWGTTNRDDYLRDETGNCRFYPVRIEEVNVAKLIADRDQLLGEAAARLQMEIQLGNSWWEFSGEAKAILECERDGRGEDHPWTAIVLAHVEDLDEVAIPAIMHAAEYASPPGLGLSKERSERKHSLAIAGILKAHGWQREGKFTAGKWKGQARYRRAR